MHPNTTKRHKTPEHPHNIPAHQKPNQKRQARTAIAVAALFFGALIFVMLRIVYLQGIH